MPKADSFPLDVLEWRGSLTIRGLSFFERGVLIELRVLMHLSARPGVLLIDGQKPTINALSSILGLSRSEADRVCRKLVDTELFDQEPLTGCLRDPAMIRKFELSAMRRRIGKRGGNPDITPWADCPPSLENGQIRLVNQNGDEPHILDNQNGDKARILDNQNGPIADYSILVKERRGERIPPMFDSETRNRGSVADHPHDARVSAILESYPTQQLDRPAHAAVVTALTRCEFVELLLRVQTFTASCAQRGVGDGFVPRASRWFDEERWKNEPFSNDAYVPPCYMRDRSFQQFLGQIRSGPKGERRRELRDAEAVRDFLLCGEAAQGVGIAELDKLESAMSSGGLPPLAILFRVRDELIAWRDNDVHPIAFNATG